VRAAAQFPASRVLPTVDKRVAALDWRRAAEDLDAQGWAIISDVLSRDECSSLSTSYSVDELFRSRVVMKQHGFGLGEYKYFAYPLPEVVSALRTALYPPLAAIANRWNAVMSVGVRYPAEHPAFLERCHQAGQTKPTPLLLQYPASSFTTHDDSHPP